MSNRERNILWIGVGLSAGLVLTVALLTRKREEALPDTSVFDSPDLPGSGQCMDHGFLRMLQELERRTGYPVFQNINSGARTAVHNAKVGGVSNSSHKIPTCRAADIRTPNREIQRMLIIAAKVVGFRRIGIAETFIHLDNDPNKPQDVAWGYPKGAKPWMNPF